MYNSYAVHDFQTQVVGAYNKDLKARISLQEKYDSMVQCKRAPLATWIYSLFCIKNICMVHLSSPTFWFFSRCSSVESGKDAKRHVRASG